MEHRYVVWHEKGGCMQVFAESEEGARDAFYDSIESCVGHQFKICGCFGPKQKLDRSKFLQITKIERIGDEK